MKRNSINLIKSLHLSNFKNEKEGEDVCLDNREFFQLRIIKNITFYFLAKLKVGRIFTLLGFQSD